MKPLKYTVAALALIAVASFTQSAKAGGNVGDVFLGFANSSQSLEFDLGSFSSLSQNESWNLGTTVSSTLGTTGVDFDIAAAGQAGGGGGLLAHQVVFTAAQFSGASGSTSSAVNTNIGGLTNNAVLTAFGSSSTSVAFSDFVVANTNASSFATEFANNAGNWGFTAGDGTFQGAYPDTTDSFTLYSKTQTGTAAAAGTFVFSTNGQGQDILTFDPTATPEPSAYALGLCAVALFLVLRRRSSVA